jgi:hypothetical protein
VGEKRRTIIVQAFEAPGKDYGVDFNLSGYGAHKEKIVCDKRKAKEGMKKTEPHVIVFELNNRTELDLAFPSDRRKAMWVSDDDSTCPETQPPKDHPVIFATSVSPERLTVENLNDGEADYKFTLNFHAEIDGVMTRIPYDPIWANNNGGDER